jgi:hypothetical protein
VVDLSGKARFFLVSMKVAMERGGEVREQKYHGSKVFILVNHSLTLTTRNTSMPERFVACGETVASHIQKMRG